MAPPPDDSPAPLDPPAPRRRLLPRLLLLAAALFLSAAVLAPRFCALGWERPYEGQRAWARAQGAGVARWVEADLERGGFSTGSARFDGEWWFGTYLMAGLGYVQTAREHPELAERHLALAARCVERLLDPRVRAFDREAWHGEDPLESLAGPQGHAAYLGYFNLLLGLLRELEPSTPHAALNDRISAALARRFAAAPHGLIATYPGELYPVDNSAGIASLAVHARVTGVASPAVSAWVERVRAAYLDPATGLLIQAVHPGSGEPLDAPRGSGSALAAYFLAYADPGLSRDLYRAVDARLSERFLGFGVVREYPATVPGGEGDIDSGPLILGYSVSATGFALAGARIHRDPAAFARIYATAWLFGAPTTQGERLNFAAGGPLGDALLFALMSAPPLAGGPE